MKLSTAIIAGMQTVKLAPGNPDCDIFGAALRVVEPACSWPADSITARYKAISDHWPWLEKQIQVPGKDYYHSFLMEIEERFDRQVCGDLTSLNDLMDYIRLIEPPCGACCSFGCYCERFDPLLRELTERQNREMPQIWEMKPPDGYYEDLGALLEEEERRYQRRDTPIYLAAESTSPITQTEFTNDGISDIQRPNIVADVIPADARRFPLGWERLETARTTLPTAQPKPPNDVISDEQRGGIVAEVVPVNVDRWVPVGWGWERLETAGTTLDVRWAHGGEDEWRASTPAGRAESFAKWRGWVRFGRVLGWSWLASLGLMLLAMEVVSCWEPSWGFWLFSVPAALFFTSSAAVPVWVLWPFLWALRSAGAWQELYADLGHNSFDFLIAETRRKFVMRLTFFVFILLVLPACLIAACDKWL